MQSLELHAQAESKSLKPAQITVCKSESVAVTQPVLGSCNETS